MLRRFFPATVFVLVLIFFSLSLVNRLPYEDEAVIAGHSYFMNELGFVKSDLYGGYLEGEKGWENRQYFYHKLFVITGMVFMKLFGFHVLSFKSVSLLFLIFFLLALWFYMKKHSIDFSKSLYFLLVSLLVFNHNVFAYGFIYRPELMVMCLGFLSFYFLHSGWKENKIYLIALAGIFAGLSTFTHLNGIIYSTAGFVFLLIKRDIKKTIWFSVFAGLFSLLYFYDIASVQDFQTLAYQFKTDPNVAEKAPLYIGLLNEQIRFFHTPKEATFTILFLFSLVLNFKYLKKKYREVMLYLLILIVSLALLSHGKTIKYGLNYYPYMAIIIIIGFKKLFESKYYLRVISGFLIILYVGVQFIDNIKLINDRINIANYNQNLASFIPEQNVKISAPSVFSFNEIYHFTIRGELAFDHHYMIFQPEEDVNLKNYFSFAYKNNDEYIIIDKMLSRKYLLSELNDLHLNETDTIYNYKVIQKTDSTTLFHQIRISSTNK